MFRELFTGPQTGFTPTKHENLRVCKVLSNTKRPDGHTNLPSFVRSSFDVMEVFLHLLLDPGPSTQNGRGPGQE